MNVSNNFNLNGFYKKDKERINLFLKKLFPYLNLNQCSIVGGLAIRHHLSEKRIKYPVRPFNDIDLIAEKIDAVSAEVSKDFLVYHYHPLQNNSFYVVLLDKFLKIKVDIFDYDPPLEDPITVKLFDYKIKMRGLEDQLVKTVFDIQRISEENNVDPKQFQDTELMMKVADLKKANKIWQKRNYDKYPKTLLAAVTRARKIKFKYLEWFKKDPFKKPIYKCKFCKNANGFKVTPMRKIYSVLGYIE